MIGKVVRYSVYITTYQLPRLSFWKRCEKTKENPWKKRRDKNDTS